MNLVKNMFRAASLSLLALGQAHAAHLVIDDSDPDFVTITAADFEGGFYVNGQLLTQGNHQFASITLTDGVFSFKGSWYDLGSTSTGYTQLAFALPSAPQDVTSVLAINSRPGNISGWSGSFLGAGPIYFQSGAAALVQDGRIETLGLPYLHVEYRSETAVPSIPEPQSQTLMLAGLLGVIGAVVRRRARG